MTKEQLEQIAINRLHQFGIYDWTIKWVRSKRVFGEVVFKHKLLKFSSIIFGIIGVNHFYETLNHEIAHILVGPYKGHGKEWKEACQLTSAQPNEFGSVPQTFYKKVPPKWLLIRPDGKAIEYMRKPTYIPPGHTIKQIY